MGAISWFQDVASAGSPEEAITALMSKPCLLWTRRWPEIEAWIKTQPVEDRPRLTAALQSTKEVAAELEARPQTLPRDLGPIEKLAAPVLSGERQLEQVLPEARAPATTDALSPLYVRVLAGRQGHAAYNGKWQQAVATFQLLLAAVDALPPGPGASEMQDAAALEWIQAVAAACNAVPDARLFRDAIRRGEALIAKETAAGHLDRAAEVMHRLGVLHLDPYISGRSPASFENQMIMWRQRLEDVYGPIVAADPQAAMPKPLEALETAVRFFEQALPNRSGESRGRTLKAAAEALRWMEIAGAPPDGERICRYAREALSLLPAAQHPTHVAILRGLMQQYGCDKTERPEHGVGAEGENYLLWADPADEVRAHGDWAAIERYVSSATQAFGEDPNLAIGLLLRVWPLLSQPGQEMRKRTAATNIINALAGIFAAPGLQAKTWKDCAALEEALAQQARKESWSAGRFAAALAGLAAVSSKFDREDEGLRILDRALEIAAAANAALVPPLRCLRAELIQGTAVNAFRANNWSEATQHYVTATSAFAEAGLVEAAVETLVRADDVAFRDPQDPPVALAIGLAANAPQLIAAGTPRLDERLHALWVKVIGRTISRQPVKIALMWLELQAAKGASLAAMLNQDSRYDWRRDPEATAMLARIEQLRAEVGRRAVPEPGLNDDLVLMGYAGAAADAADAQEDRLKNLEESFDAHVRRRMTDGRDSLKSLLTVEELEGCLGSKTALLTQFVGKTEAGQVAFITQVSTDTTTLGTVGVLALPPAIIKMGNVEMGWFGPSVAALRSAIVDEPGPAEVTPEAAASLAQGAADLLGGGLAAQLRELRKNGKDHLCIHPHGPFHFYPQHLIGPEGEPLAADWIVTYLPHPTLLRRRKLAAAPAARMEVAAMGLDFKDHVHGLNPLPGAVEEATMVAETFGGPCWVNHDATKTRLLEAFTGARRVHLATHGSQHASAPMFQRLYLYPDETSDGILHAFELVGLDLHNLDLVTLSACETSLGRFDISDSLRGLTASLFVAGVPTVIGTLWPVADAPARLFFERLYRALSEGGDKLEAFRAAQLATRKDFPAYRDWGAFQYAGLW